MATERRWILRDTGGAYVTTGQGTGCVITSSEIAPAAMYTTIHEAYQAAQKLARIAGPYRAVPVERETERTVLQTDENPRFIMWHPTRSPAAERAIHNATLFTAEDLLGMDDSWSEYKIIPVEVTEAPGPWRVVEESE
jgi:hypothetical protein